MPKSIHEVRVSGYVLFGKFELYFVIEATYTALLAQLDTPGAELCVGLIGKSGIESAGGKMVQPNGVEPLTF